MDAKKLATYTAMARWKGLKTVVEDILEKDQSDKKLRQQGINLLERCLCDLEELPHKQVRKLINDIHEYFGAVELSNLKSK